jgi:predicted DNA-binding protein
MAWTFSLNQADIRSATPAFTGKLQLGRPASRGTNPISFIEEGGNPTSRWSALKQDGQGRAVSPAGAVRNTTPASFGRKAKNPGGYTRGQSPSLSGLGRRLRVDTYLQNAYIWGMEVQFTPEIEARLDRLANETGRSKDEFVQDAMAGYFDELAQVREMLDSRYDDIKSGRVKLIPGDEVIARLRAKSAARRSQHS